MKGRLRGIALAAGALCFVTSPVFAQVAPGNKDELKCETGQSKTSAKFVSSKAKCAMKCLSTARKTNGPYTDCTPPYGGTTATCISDAITGKGAEQKAVAGITKGCTKDCPDCYADNTPSDCPGGTGFVASAETNVDTVGPAVFCLENTNMTPTKDQAKCEDGVAKALVKYVGSFGKAVSKCVTNAFNGKIGANQCVFAGMPPTVPDPATQAAIDKAAGKTADSIDKVCADVPGATPPCYALTTGTQLTGLITGILANTSPDSFCGVAQRRVPRQLTATLAARRAVHQPGRDGRLPVPARLFRPLFPASRRAC